MNEYEDDGYEEYIGEVMLKRYHQELRLHPDCNDPDHPDPEDYGLDDE